LGFSDPDSYRNYVINYASYVRSAQAGVQAAQVPLAAAKDAESKAAVAYGQKLDAAKRVLDEARREYQAPIDQLQSRLAAARNALDDAVHPGNDAADALEAEAARVASQMASVESTIRDLRYRITRLDPGSSSYKYETSRLNTQIADLQGDLDSLSRKRYSLISQANVERGRQVPYNDPGVVAARAKVDGLVNELEAAQDTYRRQTEPLLAKVDDEQQTFNRAMASVRAQVKDAEAAVETAKRALAGREAEFNKIPGEVGFFKKLWWKLTVHFDAKGYWEAQRKSLGL
jgi:chromosome segregation ATPase